MRRLVLLLSLVSLLLVSLTLTERADTADAPDSLRGEGVTREFDLDDALWIQPHAAPAEVSALDGWTTIVSEDFEGAFPGPWVVDDAVPGYGEYYWAERDCRARLPA